MTQATAKPAVLNPLLAPGRQVSTPEGNGIITAATPEQITVAFHDNTVRYYPPAALLGPITGREYHRDPFAKPEDTRYPFRVWAADPNLVVLAISASDLWGEVVEIGVVDRQGKPLFSSLVKPTCPITSGAAAYHGITDEAVQGAPSITAAWGKLLPHISGKTVVAYTPDYITGRIAYSLDCAAPGWRDTTSALLGSGRWQTFLHATSGIGCVQSAYAAAYGEFDQRYGSYSFVRFPTALAAHGVALPAPPRAVASAVAVLGLVQAVAAHD